MMFKCECQVFLYKSRLISIDLSDKQFDFILNCSTLYKALCINTHLIKENMKIFAFQLRVFDLTYLRDYFKM